MHIPQTLEGDVMMTATIIVVIVVIDVVVTISVIIVSMLPFQDLFSIIHMTSVVIFVIFVSVIAAVLVIQKHGHCYCNGVSWLQGRGRQTQLNRLVERFLLRRTKDSTIKDQLPRKSDNIVFCEMSLLQHRAYE